MGQPAGAHHHDLQGLDYLGAGDLRPRRRPDRPGAGDDFRPPRRHHGAVASVSPSSASTPRSTRSTPRAESSTPEIVGEEHYKVARQVQQHPGPLQGAAGHHRDPRYGRAIARKTAPRSTEPVESRSSCRSRSSSLSSSPALPGSYVELKDTVRSFSELVEGKHDGTSRRISSCTRATIDEVIERAKKAGAI